jgi:hypothetical protein
MKTKNMGFYSLAILLAWGVGLAGAQPKPESTRTVFENVPAAEVPAKAAAIVSLAKTVDRDVTAARMVKLAVKAHPTTIVATVGAIAAKCPESAPTTAATAAGLQPKQVLNIAHAAAKAAPAQAGAIVKAVCKVVPSASREVALMVGNTVPSATQDIIAALAEARPDFKSRLDVAIASYQGNLPSVAAVLDRAGPLNPASPTLAMTSPGSRGPTIGAPYIPLTATPTNVPPGGGVVPPGGRDYAAP